MEGGCTVHKLVADLALFSGRKVLLVKYRDVARYDGQRGWFLPDDFLMHEEHPEDAAQRIAREHTGVELQDVRLSHIESFGNGTWHLIFHYRADLPTPTVKPGGRILRQPSGSSGGSFRLVPRLHTRAGQSTFSNRWGHSS